MHFIGVLGSGCYPLACLMSSRGYTVTGSDSSARADSYTDSSGLRVTRPLAELPSGVTLSVYSLAIDESDPEILSALSRGIPLISRAQLLGALMSMHSVRISVSGSHGKSTTTAAAEHILSVAAISHVAISGALLNTGIAYTDGGGDIFLAEACEYKDSFLSLCPTHQIITSVELDHTDYFPSLSAIRSSFLHAAERADTVIINADDPVAMGIAEELLRAEKASITKPTEQDTAVRENELCDTPPALSVKNDRNSAKRILTYGRSPSADYRIASVVHRGEITELFLVSKEHTLKLTTPLMGEYNLYNISAAAVLADSLGIDADTIERAIADFHGIDRRLSKISTIDGVPVYYDYAHHPTEICAVITALKARYGTLAVIFRPHTYSRTASLWDDFVTALGMAERVVLTDVYPAREQPIEGIDSRRLAECISGAIYTPDPSRAAQLATGQGIGVVALLGAGDVEGIKAELIRLGENKIT